MKSWSESFKRRAERRRRMARAAAQLDLIFEDHFAKLVGPPPAANWLHGNWREDERGIYIMPIRRERRLA